MTWEPGDLALCVRRCRVRPPGNHSVGGSFKVRIGGLYTVHRVIDTSWYEPYASIGVVTILCFVGDPENAIRGWDARCFIKVTPGEDVIREQDADAPLEWVG